MHRLQTLGSVDLRNPGGNSVGAVLAQPKRFALLVYLAACSNGRFCRRDTLLGLFWPEFDEEHARGALRKALHYLRQSLGPDVIVRRGVEELAIDSSRLTLDTAEFERAIREGRLEEALELYRGEFLSGFIVDDAPEFDQWLTSERRRLNQLAVNAAGELADRCDAAEDRERARRYAEVAAALAPTGENELRRLLALLDRQGDRAAALAAYHTFAARLQSEFGVEPSPESRGLLVQIRARNDPSMWADDAPERSEDVAVRSEPMAAAVLQVPVPEAATPQVGAQETPAVNRPKWPVRLLRAAAIGAVVIGGAAVWQRMQPRHDVSSHVAVLPFEVQAADPLAYLDEGIAVLLAMRLDGGGGLRTIEPAQVLEHVASAGPAAARGAVARKAGAGLYVTGNVTQIAERISVEAALYSTSSQRPIARARATGAESALLLLTDSVAQQLLAAHLRDRGLQLSESAALSTSSLEALKEYLDGEEQLRAGRYEAAVESYQRAVEADSTFALAYFRLAVGANWLGRMPVARASIIRATQYSSRLNEHARRLVQGMHAVLTERFSDAERFYRETVEIYPTDTEAWFELGDAIFHGRPPGGGTIAAARAPFEQALRLDPAHLASLVHLTRIAAWEQRSAEVDSLTNRILRDQGANDHHAEALMFRVAALNDAIARNQLIDLTGKQPVPTRLLDAAWRVAAYTGEADKVEAVVKAALPAGSLPEYRAGALLLYAHSAASRGEWQVAAEQLNNLARYAPSTALVTRALFALQPSANTAREEFADLRRLIDQLAQVTPYSTSHLYVGSISTDTVATPILQYYSAQLSLRLGERAAAQATLRAMPASIAMQALGRAHIEALLLEQDHDVAGAVRLLEAAIVKHSDKPWSSVVAPRAASRVALARMLDDLGRKEEARRWRASILQDFSFDLIWSAPM